MNSAVVGAARIVFGADTSDFDAKEKGVEGALGRLMDKFADVENRLRIIGAGITAGITLPFAGMVRAVDQGAGAFEAQMNRVEAALDGVTGKQLKDLSDQARSLGPAVGKGATEAASGIEALGLAGVSTTDILGGGLKATLDLAAAGMVDTSVSASLVTDVFGQFHKTAADLPDVVKNVVGALDASKFGFQDFQLAVSQGGGVAASAGISFKDFATAVAATSSQFSSGSDAGTSFKTYIQSLVGNSDDAKYAMNKLGISFFDARGRMKPLAVQAQILRDKLGDLSDVSKTDALKTIFGSDAARTAIGLMEQGRQGFENLQATIEKGDVGGKIAKRMEGDVAAANRIAVAWESVKIAIGETGLLEIITSIKNAFASLLESIAGAPPWVLKVGAAFAGLSALLGPLVFLLGTVGTFIAVRFAAGFGLIGRAISFVFAPLDTLLKLFIDFAGTSALRFVLGSIGQAFLKIAGPIGWAITAFLLFKDSLIPVLEQIWNKLTTTLGPPLEAMMQKVQDIFAKITSGPIGSALSWLGSAVAVVADVIGTLLAGAVAGAGDVIVSVLGAAVALINGFLDVVSGMVTLISDLLRGDFSAAWGDAGDIVDAACNAVINAVDALGPGLGAPLREAYTIAKQWLADGFTEIGNWLSTAVANMVNYIASAFPGVVAAAKAVYEGVKGWLVDKFGWLLDWIKGAAKFIADTYGAMKETLGLGAATPTKEPQAPSAPKPVVVDSPKRTVDLEKPKKEKKGRNTKYDAANRAELEMQAQLQAARLRGDEDLVRSIEARLALEKQIEAYQRTGMSLVDATAAANRDIKLITDARAVQTARQIADDQRSFDIKVAEIAGNGKLEESLKKQEYLQERIVFWRKNGKDLAEATAISTAEQTRLDGAIAAARQREAEQAEQQRQIDLAKARGDTDAQVQAMERKLDIERRSQELQAGANGQAPMDKAEADAKAATEALQMQQATQQGIWRDTIRGGFRAALDGNLGDWFKNWWKDRVAKGMEQAINSLSDLIFKLFSGIGSGSGGGGGLGGLLGSLIGGIGSAFGGGGIKNPNVDLSGISMRTEGWGGSMNPEGMMSLQGFATGGSFKVGGMSGIDRNLVAFRASRGEMVDITRPGNDNGGNGSGVIMHNDFRGADAAAVPRIEAALKRLDSSIEGRSVSAVADAKARRIIR